MAQPDDTSERSSIFVDVSDDGGTVGTHPTQIDFPRAVAPSLKSDEPHHNTVKDFLIAVGCAKVPNTHFEFDSSFVSPAAKKGFIKLARLFKDLSVKEKDAEGKVVTKTPPVSLFGHADPTGDDAYNITLSQRRAKAIYGMLVRDTDLWEKLFSTPAGGDNWGKRSIVIMLDTLGFPPARSANGQVSDADLREAVKEFQRSRGSNPDGTPALKDDGDAGPKTRKELFRAYMDAVCTDENDVPFVLSKDKDFLGRGADPHKKSDMQACGEFNPQMVFNKFNDERFKNPQNKAERDESNSENRRVLIFLFKPGTQIDPAKWPCPHVDETPAASAPKCKLRFWSDGEKRRSEHRDEEKDRTFRKTEDTFGCRFYHGIAVDSPCEGSPKQWVMRLLLDVPREDQNPPQEPRPFGNRRFVVNVGGTPESPVIRGRTDPEGVLRLPVFDEVTEMTLRLDMADTVLPPGITPAEDQEKDEKGFMKFTLKAGDLKKLNEGTEEEQKLAVKQRLYNLGYGKTKLEEWDDRTFNRALSAFQRHHNLKDTNGNFHDPPTLAKLKEVYEHLPGPPPAPAS